MEYVLPTHIPQPATQTLPPPARLLWVLAIFSVIAALMMSELALLASPPPLNPFADYAALMPGQPEKAAIERGFSCLSIPNEVGTSCVGKHPFRLLPFSEVYLSATPDHLIERVSFIADGNTLMIGDLSALWGKPTHQMWGSLVVVLCWPGAYALVPLNGNREITYFSPVKMVEFTRHADSVCSTEGALEN